MDGFNQHGLALAFRVVQGIQTSLVCWQHGHDDGGNEAGKEQHHQRKFYGIGKQDGQKDQKRHHIQARGKNSPSQESANLFNLLHVPRNDTRRGRFKIINGQGEQMAKGAPRQAHVYFVGGCER